MRNETKEKKMTEIEIKKLLTAAFLAGHAKGMSDENDLYWMKDVVPAATSAENYVEAALGE